MGQRITRAKAKIKAARIPYRVPAAADLPTRVTGVLAVLFLIFNEGYLATGPDKDPVRSDLTAEAIRLTRLVRALMPDGRRGRRAAGADAAHRGPPARPGSRRAASSSRSTSRTAAPGTRRLVAEGHTLVRERLGLRAGRRAATRSSPRSTPCTLGPRRARHRLVAGRRALRPAGPARPVADRRASTGRSRSPSSTARRSRWPPSTGCDRWRATTPSTPPAPTCCAGWAAAARARGGVRPGHRARRQHRRDRLPDPSPRPAGLTARSVGTTPGHPPRRHVGGPARDGRARVAGMSAELPDHFAGAIAERYDAGSPEMFDARRPRADGRPACRAGGRRPGAGARDRHRSRRAPPARARRRRLRHRPLGRHGRPAACQARWRRHRGRHRRPGRRRPSDPGATSPSPTWSSTPSAT